MGLLVDGGPLRQVAGHVGPRGTCLDDGVRAVDHLAQRMVALARGLTQQRSFLIGHVGLGHVGLGDVGRVGDAIGAHVMS